jgi:hypothetical protein
VEALAVTVEEKPGLRSEEKLADQVRDALAGEDLRQVQIKHLSKSQVKKLAKAILVFSEGLAGVKLHQYQKEFGLRIILSVLLSDSEDITGLFARQSGKSTVVAVIVNGMMAMLPLLAQLGTDPENEKSPPVFADPRIQKFKRGFWVGIYAPSHEQSGLLFDKILHYLHSDHAREVLADDEIGIELDDRKDSARAELPNGSYAKCHSSAVQAKIEGASWHLIIGEEAQDINAYVWRKSIVPMAASTAASFVQIGTCNMVRSAFYDKCQANARADAKQKDPSLKLHFQYDYEVAAKANPWYRVHIQKKMAELGYDSDEFRMSYRLHWILERGMFVEPTLFDLMGKNYSPVTYDPVNAVHVGIDVGKSESSTVVTVVYPDYTKGGYVGEGDFRCYKRVLNWLQITGDDYVAQFGQIRDFLVNYRVLKRIMIDATGVGAAMADMLENYYRPQIEANELELIRFIADSQTNHDGYSRLLQDLQNERLEYPNSERARKSQKQRNFVQQMTNLQKVYRGAYLTVEAGEETVYKDFCSSLMLGCLSCDYAADENREVEEGDNFLLQEGRRNRRQRGLASEREMPFHRM